MRCSLRLLAVVGVILASRIASARSLDELRHDIEVVLEQRGVPGAAVALIDSSGAVWSEGFGKADLESGQPVTANTLFRVGSISKSFIAAALLTYVEEGRVRLEDRVAALCPDLAMRNPWEATDPVRLVHVLEHTAGFDDMHFNEMYNLTQSPDIPIREALAVNPRSRDVRWKPGTRAAYSNAGYGVAGYVLERVAGRPFDQVIEDRLLEPLGMHQSSFRYSPSVRRLLAQGYVQDGKVPVPYHPIYLRPAGSLHASARELGAFVGMLLRRGRVGNRQLLSRRSVERMEVPRTTSAARAGLVAGYGLGNYADVSGPVTTHGHGGGIDGFLSDYGYSPEQGVGFVVLINSSHSGEALFDLRRVVLAYLTQDKPDAQASRTQLTDDDVRSWSGTYRVVNYRHQILGFLEFPLSVVQVFGSDGRLLARLLGGQSVELVPVGANRFRLPWQTEASVVFFQEEDGTRVMAAPMMYAEDVGTVRGLAPATLLRVALNLMRSALWAAPIFTILGLILGRRREPRGLRFFPTLAVISLFWAFDLLRETPSVQLGTLNPRTVLFCAMTWSFAAFSAIGLAQSLRAWAWPAGRLARLHALIVSLACCAVALYLWHWKVLGLRTWVW